MIERPHPSQRTTRPSTSAGDWSVILAVVSLLALPVAWGIVVPVRALGEVSVPH
jgi:hypothetical protein